MILFKEFWTYYSRSSDFRPRFDLTGRSENALSIFSFIFAAALSEALVVVGTIFVIASSFSEFSVGFYLGSLTGFSNCRVMSGCASFGRRSKGKFIRSV